MFPKERRWQWRGSRGGVCGWIEMGRRRRLIWVGVRPHHAASATSPPGRLAYRYARCRSVESASIDCPCVFLSAKDCRDLSNLSNQSTRNRPRLQQSKGVHASRVQSARSSSSFDRVAAAAGDRLDVRTHRHPPSKHKSARVRHRRAPPRRPPWTRRRRVTSRGRCPRPWCVVGLVLELKGRGGVME